MAVSDLRHFAAASLALLALAVPALAAADSPSGAPTPLSFGERGDYSWSVKASHLAGLRPCVSVAITHHHGGPLNPFNYDRSRFRECVPERSGLKHSGSPLVVGGTHIGGGTKMTVFGVLADASARRVSLTVTDGVEAERVSADLEPVALPLGAVASRASRVAGLRFAVVAMPGTRCVERLATEGIRHRPLWQGTPAELSCESPAPAVAE